MLGHDEVTELGGTPVERLVTKGRFPFDGVSQFTAFNLAPMPMREVDSLLKANSWVSAAQSPTASRPRGL